MGAANSSAKLQTVVLKNDVFIVFPPHAGRSIACQGRYTVRDGESPDEDLIFTSSKGHEKILVQESEA
jgi:hypothetical protein